MNASIRIGVVGTGYWGKNLLRNLSAMGVLAAMCDSNHDALKGFAQQYPDAKPYADFDAMLADQNLDAVVIATPAETHGALAERALQAGKHVFVEKPLCLDLQQGARLIELAEQQGLRLMVGHLLLYHPAFRAVLELVEAGRLGDLRYVYSNRLSLGKIRREENSLWSFAPHDISMILRLTKCLPHRVTTTGGNYLSPSVADTTLTHLTFREGLQGHIFVSWLHPYKDHRMVVVGSEGMLVFDDVVEGHKVSLYRHTATWQGDLPKIDKAVAEPVVYDDVEPLRNECEHFIECLREGKTPISDGPEGLRVLTVLDACQRSLDQGMPIELSQ